MVTSARAVGLTVLLCVVCCIDIVLLFCVEQFAQYKAIVADYILENA